MNIKNPKGFTLIELLVAIVIFGMVIAGIVTSKIRQQGQGISQQQAVEMQQTVRAVIYLISRELRTAGFNPEFQKHDTGITTATATSLTFNRVASDDGDNNDGDSETDEAGELDTITYTFQDSDADGDYDITVEYNGGGAQLIAENIEPPDPLVPMDRMFIYFDQTGVETTAPTDVTSIRIRITATTDTNQLARSTTNNTRTLSTRVYLRNLGF
ncbi:MAG: prepilin-type N-terminal cleavage/methylation domain-containing protein [Spirochaetales bacterium]|jgi:prepilin-type N-terminal cleavage/methylation domain-containing protein|nr:prepilin-type N-terminal cleavage/methylation domain-containing protein [Spirochaetales bacterium]